MQRLVGSDLFDNNSNIIGPREGINLPIEVIDKYNNNILCTINHYFTRVLRQISESRKRGTIHLYLQEGSAPVDNHLRFTKELIEY